MIVRALDAGVPAGWVAGDEVYGNDPGLRAELERRGVGYVLAVGCTAHVVTAAGVYRADVLAGMLPKRSWQRLSPGTGAKGYRYHDWAWVQIADDAGRPGQRWLVIRRHRHTGELAYNRCYSPRPVGLSVLVRVAGRRWTVEQSFQTAKGCAGLDEHQVRTFRSWYRWTTLANAGAPVLGYHHRAGTGQARTVGLDPIDAERVSPRVG
jgi:SRSO17 transposase